jgi:hypothetical protein
MSSSLSNVECNSVTRGQSFALSEMKPLGAEHHDLERRTR